MITSPLTIGNANSCTGDNLRSAGQKLNASFDALYGLPAVSHAADYTLYVSPTGDDNNDGKTALTPFLTIQRAADIFHQHQNLQQSTPTIQLADGTYTLTSSVFLGRVYANGFPTITGNTGTPANVIVTASNSNCFDICVGAFWLMGGLELRCTFSGGSCICIQDHSRLQLSAAMRFGTSTGANHVEINDHGTYTSTQAVTITGGAARHIYGTNCATARIASAHTLTGTPAFTTAFAHAKNRAYLNLASSSYTGSATGKRYDVTGISVIATGGLTLPGNAGGTTSNGGIYS